MQLPTQLPRDSLGEQKGGQWRGPPQQPEISVRFSPCSHDGGAQAQWTSCVSAYTTGTYDYPTSLGSYSQSWCQPQTPRPGCGWAALSASALCISPLSAVEAGVSAFRWTIQRMLTDRNSGHCSARITAKTFVSGQGWGTAEHPAPGRGPALGVLVRYAQSWTSAPERASADNVSGTGGAAAVWMYMMIDGAPCLLLGTCPSSLCLHWQAQ